MKKPYSKYMDDRIVKILEKGIKNGEVQETIAMIDALLLHYTENGLDIDGDDDSENGITISYGIEPKSASIVKQPNVISDNYINDDPDKISNSIICVEEIADLIRIVKTKDMQKVVDIVEDMIIARLEDAEEFGF
jgi:hypothetical protein